MMNTDAIQTDGKDHNNRYHYNRLFSLRRFHVQQVKCWVWGYLGYFVILKSFESELACKH